MDTATRIARAGTRITPRQRRRMVKKAGRDPYAIVVRDDGMGYPPSKQGYREVVDARHGPVAPISGAGYGEGHHAVESWTDEVAP